MTVWARGLGIALVRVTAERVVADPALRRALADGIEHGHAGDLHAFPSTADWYVIREDGTDVGCAVLQADESHPGVALLWAVAIAREHRGRATATKAVLLLERRLAREGVTRLLARVPRTNGRGLYFMLRAGYTPLPSGEEPLEDGDVTWFARGARS